MRHTKAIAIYLAAVFLSAALLAPLLWKAVAPNLNKPEQEHLTINQGVGFLKFLKTHNDFHRYVKRSMEGLALLGLWLLLRYTKVNSWRDIGWVKPYGQWPWFGRGLLLGLASLAAAATVPLLVEAREFAHGQSLMWWAHKLSEIFAGALALALLEETLFRGALFGLLRRDFNWRWAALASSLLFAAAHFITQKPVVETITWTSGIATLPDMLESFWSTQFGPAKFTNLLLAGMTLCGLWQKTGNLYCSIGTHAGWIICFRINEFTTESLGGESSAIWGTEKISDGWMATPLLLFMVWFIFRGSDPRPEKRAH